MENYKGGLKGYWKQRGGGLYERIDGASGHRRPRRSRIIELGGGGARKRKFWRIKLSPKLRTLARIRFSPKRILTRIRDGYVRLMLGFANSGAISGGGGFGYGDQAINGFGRPQPPKEYDEKMILQIYKSILAQSQFRAGAEARVGGVAPPPAPARVAV